MANLVGVDVDYDINSNTAMLKTKDEKIFLPSNEYKLIDGYILNDSNLDSFDKINLYDAIEKNDIYEFNSDNFEYSMKMSNDKNIIINGKEIKEETGLRNTKQCENLEEIFSSGWIDVYLIDLNTNDNYKELLIEHEGDGYSFEIFRIKSDNKIEFIDYFKSRPIVKINGNCIIPNVISFVTENPLYSPMLVCGYYKYSDGKFIFVDRFLNGENIYDENGKLNTNFSNLEFTTSSITLPHTGLYHSYVYESGEKEIKVLDANSKIKIKNITFDDKETDDNHKVIKYAEVELVDDSTIYNWDYFINDISETEKKKLSTSIKSGRIITIINFYSW